MEDSILISIKGMLGIDKDCDGFDQEIMIFINSVFSTLYQIGFDPAKNYRVESVESKWTDILNDDPDLVDLIKPYTYMKVRLQFDPPTSSFVLESFRKEIDQLEWRIQAQAEGGFDGTIDEYE